ncbi:hypothetical protein [Clostridium akagii]|uniref:hypothetical protein n=1 Tax=Clostridium akagii TaxID=91623 RepID=UPI000AE058C0|nr:hypothetical protein [Clostridium akagii]
MKLELEKEEVKKIVDLISNRIEELRSDINDEMEDSDDELREIIRGYKSLVKKVLDQSK